MKTRLLPIFLTCFCASLSLSADTLFQADFPSYAEFMEWRRTRAMKHGIKKRQLSRDDLFRKAFNKEPPVVPKEARANIKVNGKFQPGSMKVEFIEEGENVLFSGRRLLDPLRDVLKPEVFDRLEGFLRLKMSPDDPVFAAFGLSVSFDFQRFILIVDIPSYLWGIQNHYLVPPIEDPYQLGGLKPNAFSFYTNYYFSDVFRSFGILEGRRQPQLKT